MPEDKDLEYVLINEKDSADIEKCQREYEQLIDKVIYDLKTSDYNYN